ncbi:hypothetical protein EVAR_88663_1 [Eumeta japonica]|uniref:Uncharacterized protein n=1 Tax=Eumeta variegata TaxID=151549 RepID=A0A4C1YB05_EUMVA|nr:hypothetical protein EVAR_88663_1 [Eumeta japonica]
MIDSPALKPRVRDFEAYGNCNKAECSSYGTFYGDYKIIPSAFPGRPPHPRDHKSVVKIFRLLLMSLWSMRKQSSNPLPPLESHTGFRLAFGTSKRAHNEDCLTICRYNGRLPPRPGYERTIYLGNNVKSYHNIIITGGPARRRKATSSAIVLTSYITPTAIRATVPPNKALYCY